MDLGLGRLARPAVIKSDVMPPAKGAAYPIFVPKTDAEGRDLSGLRLPTLEGHVATHTGWNLRKASFLLKVSCAITTDR
jgi:hypothetical protein